MIQILPERQTPIIVFWNRALWIGGTEIHIVPFSAFEAKDFLTSRPPSRPRGRPHRSWHKGRLHVICELQGQRKQRGMFSIRHGGQGNEFFRGLLTFHHLCVSGSSPIFAMSRLKSSSDVLLIYRMWATRRCVVPSLDGVAEAEGTSGSSKWWME